jgi:VWFA-related protein
MKLLLACALAVATLASQPTFRASTTLVEFTLVALDDGGRPVTDLRKEDLVITEDGQPREIAFLQFDGGIAAREAEALTPGVFTNRSEYAGGPPKHVTAILIDGIFTAPAQQQQGRNQVLGYLDSIESDTRVALYHSGDRLRVLHDYTSNLATLRAQIAKLLSSPFALPPRFDLEPTEESAEPPNLRGTAINEMRRLEQHYQETAEERKRRTAIASLEVVGDHLAGIAGRKSLVWITIGFPVRSTFDGFLEIHAAQVSRVAERLANVGVSVYPVDTQGLLAPRLMLDAPLRSARGGGPPPPPRALAGLPDQRNWATMDLVADVTGGRVSRNTNDVAKGLKAAEIDQRGSYSIAFYTPIGERNPATNWRRIEVKSHRANVRLSHRNGYLADAPPREPLPDWSREQWRWAISNPLGSTVLHLDAKVDVAVGASEDNYGLLLLLTPEQLQFRPAGQTRSADVDVVIAEKSAQGDYEYRLRTSTFSLPNAPVPDGTVLRYTDRWRLRPGTTVIRVLVRDRSSGRYGTLDVPVKLVPAVRAAPAWHDGEINGRSAWILENGRIRVGLVRNGGHIAEVRLLSDNPRLAINPMYMPTGSGYMGHLVCFPHFGPASPEERQLGLGGHGEAGAVEWRQTRPPAIAEGQLTFYYGAELPKTRYKIERAVSLRAGEPVARIEEWIENLTDSERPYNRDQHATFGAPFVAPAKNVLDMSGTKALSDPKRTALERWRGAAEFSWPTAPAASGSISLREFRAVPSGQVYTPVLTDMTRPQSWFTLYNTDYPLLVGYIFPTSDHPWIIDWQNQPRTDTTAGTARGIEFGTSPFDEGLQASIDRGEMFGVPTYKRIAADERVSTTFAIFLSEIPNGFSGVQNVRSEKNRIVVTERGAGRELTIPATER